MDASIASPHEKIADHILKVRTENRLFNTQCVILLEHNSSTQAAIVSDHANLNAAMLRNCVFLTFGRAKLAQGGTTRIPGIKTMTSTKASMVQYIRLAINPMPLADNSIKLYFKASLKKQYCHYRQSQGQKATDIPTVYESLVAQLSRFKKKTETRNGNIIITFTGKPEKDDKVIGLGLAFLVAYTLTARAQALLNMNRNNSQYMPWADICECIKPDDLNKAQYINQMNV